MNGARTGHPIASSFRYRLEPQFFRQPIELDPQRADISDQHFGQSEHAGRIRLLRGNALEILPTLQRDTYDLIFNDLLNSFPDEQATNCLPAPAFIEVTPPDETTQLVVPWTLGGVCGHGAIDVMPLAPGAGPPA